MHLYSLLIQSKDPIQISEQFAPGFENKRKLIWWMKAMKDGLNSATVQSQHVIYMQ